MKAIVIQEFGGLESLVIKERPEPEEKPNHMRKGEWAEAAEISGIECVGIVKSCPNGEFKVGTKVAALMGGMGRSINGSYAQYTCVPTSNVVEIDADLPWEELAAIPESYATAWTCLFRNLDLKKGQTVIIRGATSSFGQAAVKLAVNAGAKVIATSRNKERFGMLEAIGASRVEIEGPGLSERIAEKKEIDAVLDLVGNSTILDSLAIVRRDGKVCLAGFLGGLDPVHEFNPLLQMPSGVHFSFFGSFVFGTPGFPLNDVPLQSIARDIANGKFNAKPSRVFKFEEIREAHRVMEANEANGKLVVLV
jgi:NADPH2:quinone reductase